MPGLCLPAQQGGFGNAEIWRENTKASTLISGNTPTPVLEKPFNNTRVPHCKIHLVFGSFISEEPEERRDWVPYDLCKPAHHTSAWQAFPPRTTICLQLLQVCFFSCSPFLPVSLVSSVIFRPSPLDSMQLHSLSKTQEGPLIKDKIYISIACPWRSAQIQNHLFIHF